MKHDERIQELSNWLAQQYPHQTITIQPLLGDASFRRYFRFQDNQKHYMVMDAPPDREDCRPFVQVAKTLAARGVQVPVIHAQDLDRGFLVLDDFGDTLLLEALTPDRADSLYSSAIHVLVNWQQHGLSNLPTFSPAFALQETLLFLDWFLLKHCELPLTKAEQEFVKSSCQQIAECAEWQPQTIIHRDYHSRNLMLLPDNSLGIIDFQDAMLGPITYDLVSLLRDCYIAWPKAQVEAWALYYFDLAREKQLIASVSPETFLRWFDWQGMQRHLKAIGIFSRLFHRDQKNRYLGDIPRTLNYLLTVAKAYPELAEFHAFLTSKIPSSLLS